MDRLQGSMEALSALQITEDMDGLDVQSKSLLQPESRAIDTKNFPLVWLNCCSRNGSRGYPSYALE